VDDKIQVKTRHKNRTYVAKKNKRKKMMQMLPPKKKVSKKPHKT